MSNDTSIHGWGVVGTGWFADSYFVPAIIKTQNTRLVAVYSRDKARGSAFAAKHKTERSYSSYSELLRDPDVEVVYIASPNNMHASQTIQAAQAGKHILCEKPMALTTEDCEQMIEACQQNRVKLGVDFQNRHHPVHLEAYHLIHSGMIGEITLATIQYSHGWLDCTFKGWRSDPELSGGGSLMGMGVHCLDLLRFLVGKEVEEVLALTDQRWSGQLVDETVLILLKFENGPFCSVISGIHVPRAHNDIVIYGTKARITGVDTVGMPLKGELNVVGENHVTKMEFPCSDPITGNYVRQIAAFNKCIEENTEPNSSGIDGLEMARLTTAIIESSKQRRAVRMVR